MKIAKRVLAILAFVILTISVSYAKENERIVEGILNYYDELLNSEEWKTYSYQQRVSAADTDFEICSQLSTAELFELAVAYPLSADVSFYNNIYDGFEHMKKISNVHNVLLNRDDLKLVFAMKKISSATNHCGYLEELLLEELEEYYHINPTIANVAGNSVGVQQVTSTTGFVAEQPSRNITLNGGASYLYGKYYKYDTYAIAYKFTANDYTSSQKAAQNSLVATQHPTFSYISGATKKFNCHSYAWVSSSYNTNIYWIDNPYNYYSGTGVSYYGQNCSNPYSNARIVIFDASGSAVHSVIASATSSNTALGNMEERTFCTSKLGTNGVYSTSLQDMMVLYHGVNYKIYRIN